MADDIEQDDLPAEPIELPRFDMHSAWRILLWGASAAMAVAIVAGTTFSDVGAERLKQTVASLWPPSKADTPAQVAQHKPTVTPEQLAALEQQTRELTQTVRELAAERDRVNAKLASVEQNLGDITGAIKKQAAQVDQFAGQLASQLSAPREPTAPPPAVSTPQTVAAVPSPLANPADPAPDTPVATATTSPAIETSPPIAGPVPLPPTRVAALENAATIRELGVDVGGAASVAALHTHWAGLKANVGPDIVGLVPSFAMRSRPSGGNDYRLVLGPLPNTTAALRLCAKLIAARINCHAGTFSVQRLANAAAVPAPAPLSAQRLPSLVHDSIINR